MGSRRRCPAGAPGQPLGGPGYCYAQVFWFWVAVGLGLPSGGAKRGNVTQQIAVRRDYGRGGLYLGYTLATSSSGAVVRRGQVIAW